jgi:1-deoxy-D-xylulose-5-phosphate synthase
VIAIGSFAAIGIDVSERLRAQGIGSTVIDPGWVSPVAPSIVDVARDHRLVIVLEDGIRAGGIGSSISRALQDADVDVPLRSLGVPVAFLDHGRRTEVLAACGLTAQEISRQIVETIAGRVHEPGVDRVTDRT